MGITHQKEPTKKMRTNSDKLMKAIYVTELVIVTITNSALINFCWFPLALVRWEISPCARKPLMAVCPPAESCCEYPHTNNENYEADKHGQSEILYFISHYQETEYNQKNAQNYSWQSSSWIVCLQLFKTIAHACGVSHRMCFATILSWGP